MKCGLNFLLTLFWIWGGRVLVGAVGTVETQHLRCWEQNASPIQILRHFEKGARCHHLRLAGQVQRVEPVRVENEQLVHGVVDSVQLPERPGKGQI